jgi:hypothetical protein
MATLQTVLSPEEREVFAAWVQTQTNARITALNLVHRRWDFKTGGESVRRDEHGTPISTRHAEEVACVDPPELVDLQVYGLRAMICAPCAAPPPPPPIPAFECVDIGHAIGGGTDVARGWYDAFVRECTKLRADIAVRGPCAASRVGYHIDAQAALIPGQHDVSATHLVHAAARLFTYPGVRFIRGFKVTVGDDDEARAKIANWNHAIATLVIIARYRTAPTMRAPVILVMDANACAVWRDVKVRRTPGVSVSGSYSLLDDVTFHSY